MTAHAQLSTIVSMHSPISKREPTPSTDSLTDQPSNREGLPRAVASLRDAEPRVAAVATAVLVDLVERIEEFDVRRDAPRASHRVSRIGLATAAAGVHS